MSTAALLLPNQLFAQHPGLVARPDTVVLFEDPLFFGDACYPAKMHKQKLWLHRASMARYRDSLVARGFDAAIWPFERQSGACLRLFQSLRDRSVSRIVMADPVDFIAEKRLRAAAGKTNITLDILPSPGFLNTQADNLDWSASRKRWFMAEFYKSQRRRLNVLMDGDQPTGGQWSFDEENRKKVPKALLGSLPWIDWPAHDAVDEAAKASVLAEFPDALGSLDRLYYPTSHKAASDWLAQFLERRFNHFGDYEDAIVEGENWLWHAVLTPALNIGLLTPRQVLDAALAHADRKGIPLNSVEGFIRQIIGWREFMRATYESLGVPMRTTNHWGHHRAIPRAFYDGTTGIDPLDDTIKRVLETGYCHHIERLMVLGGFMFLCEIDPDDVYRWFMEMFVDSYDWVMVPNAYAMSQHADGGLITTKPYFSGSNYVRKMSHWGKGPWADIWDGLYWRFILKHSDILAGNPRWAMMCRTAERMSPEVKTKHVSTAEAFLGRME
ncbi:MULTISPECIES: cryptochrome/photolyase family protein [unclassified Ruegeria]|uniref:cryptochrome/photolyase family protein n=1 Tax=unclassified Ruegeria TaxID=2625375 RepID=UPI001491C0D0|nr:cryptochrome/photolyase family protein [Ruegeria sp. HKCCD5849]NOD53480.1 cryptochrome/photolyase family protein [Ruegeria sp. HKCCD5851]NOD70042.1 cryptochrome/photolyase family protein [Ruegeria sp. HKCCD7303]